MVSMTGFVGGCLTSAFGTGGPAILMHVEEAGWKRHPETSIRANLQLVFFSTNVLAIISQIANGIINEDTFTSTFDPYGLRIVGLTFLAKAVLYSYSTTSVCQDVSLLLFEVG